LAEDLNLVFPKQDADAFRITLDDADTDPVIVRAATPRPTFRANAPLAETPLRILRREDGPVETRITVELPARNVLLAEVVLAAEDAAFQRPVRVVRRVRSGDENAFDEILGAESLCRWPGEDGKTFERLSIPVARRCDSRDVDIVVANGDNPPLKITSLGARVAPTTLVFNATEPGTYRLILGNPAAGPVRYDLDGLRDRLDKKQRFLAEAGPLQSNPDYAPPAVAPDLAERVGIERTLKALEQSDAAIALLDGSRALTEEDRRVAELTRGKSRLVVALNKSDLPFQANADEAGKLFARPALPISAQTGDGVDALLAQLKGLLASEAVREASGPVLVTSLRHRQCLERAAQALGRALALRGDDWMEECLAVELHSALDAFGEIVGETVSEDVLGEIFSKFCIGK
jgi:hypothetical protein